MSLCAAIGWLIYTHKYIHYQQVHYKPSSFIPPPIPPPPPHLSLPAHPPLSPPPSPPLPPSTPLPQLSPRFPYVHTLLGHEYVMLKDFEKAMSAFQTAVSLDLRHYNAWYVYMLGVLCCFALIVVYLILLASFFLPSLISH